MYRHITRLVLTAAALYLCAAAAAQAPTPQGLLLWLKADGITGLQSGAAVASWPDGSGHNRTATQADAGSRPAWVPDGLNGKPTVRFAGKQWLDTPEDLALPHTHSMFVIARAQAGDENGVFLWFESGDRAGPACGAGRFGTSFRLRNYPGIQDRSTSNAPAVFSVVAGDTEVAGYVNGVDDQFTVKNKWTGDFEGGAKLGGFRLGKHGGSMPQFLTGGIGEVLVYDRALSRGERQSVEQYLGRKWGVAVGAATFLSDEKGGRPTLGNGLVSAAIAPTDGARVLGFTAAPDLANWVVPATYSGLFADHFWGHMPGEMMFTPWEMEVLKQTPEEAAVKFTRLSEGRDDPSQPVDPILSKLLVEKTLSVKAGVPAVFCHVRVKNTDTKAKLVPYWQQNIVFPLGVTDPQSTVMLRPSRRGVRVLRMSAQEHYVRDVMAGWTAIVDTKRQAGMVFLLDYNKLGFLYNAAPNYTTEWVAEDVYVPAGKEWEVDNAAVPFRGFGGLQYASPRLLADVGVERTGGRIKVTYRLASALEKVAGVKLSGEVYSVLDKKTVSLPEAKLGALTAEPATVTVDLAAPGQDPLVLRIRALSTLATGEVTDAWETFYVGKYQWGDNITLDMTTPVYVGEPPAKQRTILRPDNLSHPVTNEIYYIEGLMADRWRLDQLWLQLVPWSKYRKSFYTNSFGVGGKIVDFPYDYDELMRKQLIVLCNVQVRGAGAVGMAMLRDYVAAGGGLFVFGGHVAYGAGGWEGSVLEELLPVKTSGRARDLIKARNPEIRAGPTPGDLLLDVDLAGRPQCYYYHDVEPRPDALVALTVDGGKPFLVARQYEKGYVVCFTGTPVGEPKAGDNPFWDWNGWATVLRNCFFWASNQHGALH